MVPKKLIISEFTTAPIITPAIKPDSGEKILDVFSVHLAWNTDTTNVVYFKEDKPNQLIDVTGYKPRDVLISPYSGKKFRVPPLDSGTPRIEEDYTRRGVVSFRHEASDNLDGTIEGIAENFGTTAEEIRKLN